MIKRILAVLLLVAALFCGGVLAATEGYGSLTVNVLDTTDSHNPLPNAQVVLTAESGTFSNIQKTAFNGNGAVEFLNVPAGAYSVTVSKEGYIPQVKNVTVGTTVAEIAVYLAQDTPVMLKITNLETGVAISNATITLNNNVVGKTDDYGRISVVMTRGANNNIQVNAPSYVPYTESRYINSDETAITISLPLSQVSPLFLIYNKAKLPVSGATVTVNGTIIAYSDNYGRAQLPIYTAGVTYPVTVTCDGYTMYADNIEFKTDRTDYVVTLPYASSPVMVTVKSGDKALPGALVYVDGVNKGQTGTDGTFTMAANPGTTFLLSASVDGYSGNAVSCTVEANAVNAVTVEMKKNIPTTMIALCSFAGIIVLLIVILIVIDSNRKRKTNNNQNTYAPTRKRDSL